MSALDSDSPRATPSGFQARLQNAARMLRTASASIPRLALDIALPTLCVSCREPVCGEGVCAACWSRLSFIARPYCERLGIPFVYDPGPGLLSMEAIANPPAYVRARAAVRYDDVARGPCSEISGPNGPRAGDGPLDGACGRGTTEQRRRVGTGAAALEAKLEPPLQPIRRAGTDY